MALPLQGDQVARGLASVLLQRQAREQAAKNRMNYLVEQERLRREREEARREEKLANERSTTRRTQIKEKANKKLDRLKQIELAIGSKNLQTNFGREDPQYSTFYDRIGKRIIQTPVQAQGVNSERVANILLGTDTQQFNAVERFRETRGGRIIDPTIEIKRRQDIRKNQTEFNERDSDILNEQNQGKHDTQVAYIERKISGAKARDNKDEMAYWEDQLRKISETQYDYFVDGVPKYKRSTTLERKYPKYAKKIKQLRDEGYSESSIESAIEKLNAR